MEQNIPTSFIPKKSLATSSAKNSLGKQRSISIVFLFSLIVFIGVIIIAVSLFLWNQFLLQNIGKKKESLERAYSAFEPSLIQEMGRLDIRINSANEILSNHKAVSSFFNLLESLTITSMQFENLNYQTSDSGEIKITMKGKAPSFGTIALQSDIFGENKFIQDPIFSNLNLNNKGNVEFDFSALLDPRLVLYGNVILNN